MLASLTKLELPKGNFSFDAARIVRSSIHFLTRIFYKPTYIGFENIPATGPAILICNHVSYVDGPIIDAGCKRPVRYLIDKDIYNLPLVHYVMSLGRAIPITYNRKSVEAAFDEISAGLRAGDLICIFPEGYLTFTGSLGRFKPGIEAICRRDPDVPVIPIALSGLWGSMLSRKYLKSPLRWWPRKWGRTATLVCGPAIASDKVNVNHLQEVVLKLKYSINNNPDETPKV
jgi:1-acyl-sn-glycerol-3-phosphate acyltransferase